MRTLVCLLTSMSVMVLSVARGQDKEEPAIPEPKIKIVSVRPWKLPTKSDVVRFECTLEVTNKDAFTDVFFERGAKSATTGKTLKSRLFCSVVDSTSGKKYLPSMALSSSTRLDNIAFFVSKNDSPKAVYLEIRDLKTKKNTRSADVAVVLPTTVVAEKPIEKNPDTPSSKPADIPRYILDYLAKAEIPLSTGLREFLEAKPNPYEKVKPENVMDLVDKLMPPTGIISPTLQQTLIAKQKTLIDKQKAVLGDVQANLQHWFNSNDLNSNGWLDEMELAKAFRDGGRPYALHELARRKENKEKLDLSYGEFLAIRPKSFEKKNFGYFTFLLTWDENQDRQVSKNEYSKFVHNTGNHVKVNLNILHEIEDLNKKLVSATLSAARRQEYLAQKANYEREITAVRANYRYLDHLMDMARAQNYAWLAHVRAGKK